MARVDLKVTQGFLDLIQNRGFRRSIFKRRVLRIRRGREFDFPPQAYSFMRLPNLPR
jgi:hypothetical protein